MQIQVACYAGYRGEETPRQIRLGERKIEVKEIQDRWLAPNHRYFKAFFPSLLECENMSINCRRVTRSRLAATLAILRITTYPNEWS